MTVEERYQERYKSGETPWDLGQPDFNLIEVVAQKPIPSCKVLDVGCGTGDNSIRLARIVSTVLLLKSGYSYVPYSSLERVIENHKDQYYLALRRAQSALYTDHGNLND
jgi:2-polyprenyl-3-methyl-5-hydroxy-6-metoxy-1,4-benzoquinol methylase